MGWVFIVAVLGLGAFAVAIVHCFRAVPARLALLVVVPVAVCTMAAILLAAITLSPPPQEQISLLAETPQQMDDQEFVTSTTCRACHPQEYASWHATYHRTMTQLATPEAVLAPFDNVQLKLNEQTFQLSREGDQFWAELPDPAMESLLLSQGSDTSRGQYVPKVRRRVILTTGSHHLQHYWVAGNPGQGLFSLPWEYHIAAQRWIPFMDAHVVPPDQKRAVGHWNGSCITCHSVNGFPGLNPLTGQWSTQVAELGIACEACHGPGGEHVAHHRNPLNRYRQRFSKQPDPTIVNPAHCSSQVSAEICGQCHSTFHMVDPQGQPDYVGYLVRGNAYRAGGDLAGSIRLLSPQLPGATKPGPFRNLYWNENDVRHSFWQDGAVRVGGREYLGLLDSPCFLRGEMTCLSCHSMHDYARPAGQMANDLPGNQSCVVCHESIGQRIEEHTHHPPDSSGSLCYNCHMPNTSVALMRAARAHRIDSPNVAASAGSGRPNACNLCHLDQTLTWSAAHLSQWYGISPPTLDADEQEVAAALLWLLKGDAAQRAVTAWHMGWSPAQQASGTAAWQAPFLAILLEDPYSVVRYMAAQSLRTLPDFGQLEFDYIGTPEHWAEVSRRVRETWGQRASGNQPDSRLLLKGGSVIDEARLGSLLEQRDDSPVKILE